ncbi:MAG: family intrarane metalloprotease [Mucilaginibacter sp.]|nr:family intrarane metalloprotease [Mucilaginibacter sp.]
MALNKKHRIWADVIMIAFVMLFAHYGHLPVYAFPFVVLGVTWIYLNLNGESFSAIGFRFSDLRWRAFYTGGATGLAYAAFHFWILGRLITHLGFKSANLSDFNFSRHHFINDILLLLLAALLVIPYQEIVFRGFIFNRVKAMFKGSFVISGLITSILFAIYHWQQGVGAVIAIFIFALFITGLYKVFKGNLWYLIFFRLAYDVFMLTMILLGKM